MIFLTVHASIEFNSHPDIRIPGHRINSEVSTIERTGKLVLNDDISVIVSFEHLKYNFMGINETEAICLARTSARQEDTRVSLSRVPSFLRLLRRLKLRITQCFILANISFCLRLVKYSMFSDMITSMRVLSQNLPVVSCAKG